MFAQPRRLFKPLSGLLLLIAALVAIGCGGEGEAPPEDAAPPTETPERQGEEPAPEPDVEDADTDDVAVIVEWAETLGRGDVEGAAELFALPSVVENGTLVSRLESRADAVAFNRTLPCGADLVSAETTGELTAATFRLRDRPGGDCGAGAGETAATSFLIEDGLIVEWRRIGTERDRGGSGESTT